MIGLDRSSGVDAADPDQVAAFLQDKPPIDALVHVAGTVNRGTIEDHSLADWRRVLDDNLTTVFVTCRAVVPGCGSASAGRSSSPARLPAAMGATG
ncbi:MAG: hypothetical protein KatS3mg061_0630 [Dehalococcoidia bacterium]|nr:MAG: hypothetical protein KatS3mg061_0630 [Dehalococcoidia bacterium]